VSDNVAGDGALPQPAPAEAGLLAQLYQLVLSSTPEQIIRGLELIDSLSDRESAVFERLGLGCNNRGIAQQLTLSERTVKRHVSAALRKLGVESRLQAGLVAQLARLLQIKAPSDPKVAFTNSGVSDDTVAETSPPNASGRPGS